MKNIIETIKYKFYVIEIMQDEIPINPCEDWDMLGTMVCCHKRYTLGHKQYDNAMEALYNSILECSPVLTQIHIDFDEMIEDQFMNKYWKIFERHAIMLPIYMYDHSGLTINTTGFSCPWDSGQLGFTFVSKNKVKDEYGWKIISPKRFKEITKILNDEVKSLDDYLTGNVYGYNIDNPYTGESIDSCWGFYGSDWKTNGMMEYAENAIDCDIESINKEKAEALIIETGDMDQVMLG